jgi:hypothetical protein
MNDDILGNKNMVCEIHMIPTEQTLLKKSDATYKIVEVFLQKWLRGFLSKAEIFGAKFLNNMKAYTLSLSLSQGES